MTLDGEERESQVMKSEVKDDISSCTGCGGSTADPFDNEVAPDLTDEQLEAELAKEEAKVSGLRTRLLQTGYKSIWQTETINHAEERTVVSSWVPAEVPTDGFHSPKAYRAAIYEDVLLVERYESEDGLNPNSYCGSSTYIHGVGPARAPIGEKKTDADYEHERAAQAIDEQTGG
jgi:hypothetical protein